MGRAGKLHHNCWGNGKACQQGSGEKYKGRQRGCKRGPQKRFCGGAARSLNTALDAAVVATATEPHKFE